MTKLFIGGLIVLLSCALKASASFSQVPLRTGCYDLAEAKKIIKDKHG